MLKAIHAQEDKKAAREKAKAVVEELRAMKLKEAAEKVEDGIKETLTCYDFSSEHWFRICTDNAIERINWEIRRTRVVRCFPDSNSALMLFCTCLRYVVGTQWGNKEVHEYEALGGSARAYLKNRKHRLFAQNSLHYLKIVRVQIHPLFLQKYLFRIHFTKGDKSNLGAFVSFFIL